MNQYMNESMTDLYYLYYINRYRLISGRLWRFTVAIIRKKLLLQIKITIYKPGCLNLEVKYLNSLRKALLEVFQTPRGPLSHMTTPFETPPVSSYLKSRPLFGKWTKMPCSMPYWSRGIIRGR